MLKIKQSWMLHQKKKKKKRKSCDISDLTMVKTLTDLRIQLKKIYVVLFEHLLSNVRGEQVLYLVASLMIS